MPDYKLTIPGSLPGLNEYITAERSNIYKAANMKKSAEVFLILHIKQQLRDVKISEPVYIKYLWIEKNSRRDKDNIAFAKKFIQDALIKTGVLENDGWAQVVGFNDEFGIDKNNPRIEITIKINYEE